MSEYTMSNDPDWIIADAASSVGKSPAERMQMFADLLRTFDAIWSHLTPEERQRRMRIADEIHRRPEPWWKNLRAEAIPDSPCRNS
jgi:hypothetical protein